MFDAETARLISSAPPLDGLDLDRLPQFLTQAYALVIQARLRAGNPTQGESEPDQHWAATVSRLKALADTYEGLTIFLEPDDPHRDSCAFVSASAHLALNQIRRLREPSGSPIPSITRHAVSPEVAACLLFLIGGHQADAAEATKAFTDPSAVGEALLLSGLAALSSGSGGQIRRFLSLRTEPSNSPGTDYVEAAAQALWGRLVLSLQSLCRRVLGEPGDDPMWAVDDVLRRITEARSTFALGDAQVPVEVRLDVEGPYHVGRLLKAAISVMVRNAVVSVPVPSGIDRTVWSDFLRQFASGRPFLWRNHVDAIGQGFLEHGQSFALTFPTGAGKTTITELRIAAEVLRGRDVVCLAPTRALVDQTYRSLTKTLETIGAGIVKGQLLEDFGERAGGSVYVQTPEQCLAYLSHEPTAHTTLGLIVVDECHQLSGAVVPVAAEPGQAPRLPGRRAVDAMWTLLTLLSRSPESDVVLISAMLRNGDDIAKWLGAATGRPARVLDLAWKPTRQVRGVVAYDKRALDALTATLSGRRQIGDYKRTPSKVDAAGIAAVPIGLFCHKQVWDQNTSYSKLDLLPVPVVLKVNRWWKITANRNEVAGRLLAATGRAGIRSIVFTQNLTWTSSIANVGATDLQRGGASAINLTERENALYAAAAEELGDDELVERPVGNLVGIHHGLLLLSERIATESAFQRSDGLTSLVATPTVAQGINLPAEAVIIAGDDRWEANSEGGAPETLAVHELLNAAGRAGRAGHFAHGVVVDVPGQVLSVEAANGKLVLKNLEHVMSLFGQPDQCLDIVDPLTQVLDRVASGAAAEGVSQYLVRRVSGLSDEQLRRLLGAALGNALRADRDVVVARQEEMLRALKPAEADAALEPWRELAAQTACSPEVLLAMAASMPPLLDVLGWTFHDLFLFVAQMLIGGPGALFDLVEPGATDLGRILPRQRSGPDSMEDIAQWETRARVAIDEVLPVWVGGETLLTVGEVLRRHRGPKARASSNELGRRFAIQTASALGHAASVICRVMQRTVGIVEESCLASWLKLLPGCIREGFDDPDKLLMFRQLMTKPGLFPRVLVHRRFAESALALPPWTEVFAIEERRWALRVLSHEP